MDAVKKAVELLEERESLVNNLHKLRNMQGVVKSKEKDTPKCHTVAFESEYGAHAHLYDEELTVLLVDTAIRHITEKLQGLELLLGLADMALQKQFKEAMENVRQEDETV